MTNRLKQAWLALCGKLEPEAREVVREVHVMGEPHVANVYVVSVPDKDGGHEFSFDGRVLWHKHNKVYFASCDQAYAEHPGEYVKQERAIRIGDRHFMTGELKEFSLQPKPKIAKGKRRNG